MKNDIPTRKIRVDKQLPLIQKEQLWRVIGYSVECGALIIENPITEEWEGRYSSTGAGFVLPEKRLKFYNWGRDAAGKQIDEVKRIVEFVAPPDERKPDHHAESCRCHICKPYHDMVDDFGRPGD